MFRILGLQILLYFHVSAIEFAGDKCFRAKLDSIRFDRSIDNIWDHCDQPMFHKTDQHLALYDQYHPQLSSLLSWDSVRDWSVSHSFRWILETEGNAMQLSNGWRHALRCIWLHHGKNLDKRRNYREVLPWFWSNCWIIWSQKYRLLQYISGSFSLVDDTVLWLIAGSNRMMKYQWCG